MAKVQDIIAPIEAIAPKELQESYDNVGLQCGGMQQEVSRVLTCIDITEAVVDEAIAQGCQMIVSHHPLIFRGVKNLVPEQSYIHRTLVKAIKNDIALYCAHTNLDNAVGGVNYKMAEVLGMTDVEPMSEGGVIGNLAKSLSPIEFIKTVKEKFQAERVCSNLGEYINKEIKRVALCGGSGAEFIADAASLGADAFLTGEIKYHDYFDHATLLLVEAGHYETEQYTKHLLREIITKQVSEVEVLISEVRTNPRSVH